MEETSAGALIFRQTESGRVFLLLHYPSGHWDFVKGKMEENENPSQTVIREAREETGIEDLFFINGFERTIEYDFQFRGETIHKKVIFFLARTEQEKVVISHEHQDYVWLPFEEALQKTTYENAKRLLLEARSILQNTL